MSHRQVTMPDSRINVEEGQIAQSTVHRLEGLPPSSLKLRGCFDSFFTPTGLPNEDQALTLLRTISAILSPCMSAHGIELHRLAEIKPDDKPNDRGFSSSPGTKNGTRVFDEDTQIYPTNHIALRLRDDQGPKNFHPLEVLLDAACHELAHCWVFEHNLEFLRRWEALVDEVENDLSCKIFIARGAGVYAAQLRWLRWKDDDENVTKEKVKQRNPSIRAIAAAQDWERRFWNFDALDIQFEDDL
jgi:hypothetical protein